MIAFDTNVLVRILVEDDERQARRAREVLENATESDARVLLPDIVLSEMEWVLDSAYGVPRDTILSTLQQLLADPRFEFEDRDRAASAAILYQQGKGDLADYLLGLQAESSGARTTYTFDRALRGLPAFTCL